MTHELKFKRAVAWSKYMTALQSGKSDQECIQLMNEYEILNNEWKRENRK